MLSSYYRGNLKENVAVLGALLLFIASTFLVLTTNGILKFGLVFLLNALYSYALVNYSKYKGFRLEDAIKDAKGRIVKKLESRKRKSKLGGVDLMGIRVLSKRTLPGGKIELKLRKENVMGSVPYLPQLAGKYDPMGVFLYHISLFIPIALFSGWLAEGNGAGVLIISPFILVYVLSELLTNSGSTYRIRDLARKISFTLGGFFVLVSLYLSFVGI